MNFVSFCVLFIIFSLNSFADANYSGFSKFELLNLKSLNDNSESIGAFQINRISLLNDLNEQVSLEFSYELSQVYIPKQDDERSFFEASAMENFYRVIDSNRVIYRDQKNYYLMQNFDRLLVSVTGEVQTLVFGRQQVSFGSGRTVNPTDIFTPFKFNTIDTEVRNGVDGIRYRQQFLEMGQIDLGVVFGDNFKSEKSAAFLAIKFPSFHSLEAQPILIHFQKASLIGLELNANLLDASWWLEGASVKSENEDGYLRWVSGIERQLTPNLSMYLEYYHNGAGSLETQNYSRLAETFAYKYGRVFLLGREYLNWGSQWLITPLHSVSFTWKVNLLDGSDFVASQWEWNFKENLYLNLGGYLGFGKKSDDRSILNSEFGDQGVILYSMLRYYF